MHVDPRLYDDTHGLDYIERNDVRVDPEMGHIRREPFSRTAAPR